VVERSLRLYISAAEAMDAECELLGQLVARIPSGVSWVVKRTPGPHEPANPDLGALRSSHFYLILLGGDIVAPIGWNWTPPSGRGCASMPIAALRRWPPGGGILRPERGVRWQLYRTPQEFIAAGAGPADELMAGSPAMG